MRQGFARYRGSGLRIAVAMLLALAIATAATVDQTEAQLPNIEVPGVVTVQASPPKLTVTTPALPPLNVTPPAVKVPSTPVTPSVTITPPSVKTPPIAIPKQTVTAPKPPSVNLPQAPAVQAPKVASPKLPQVDAPQTQARPQSGAEATPPAAGSGAAIPRSASGAGTAGSSSTSGPSTAALASLGVPSAATLRAASPAQRRQLLRRTWNRPLRGKRLRQLRRTLEQYETCLGGLPQQGRRVLRLRAGVGPGQPLSRRVVARRLGISLTRALRVERSALRQLVGAGTRGGCGGGGSVLAAADAGVSGSPAADARGVAAARRGSNRTPAERDARDQPAADKSRAPGDLFDPSREGDNALEPALFLLLVLLVLGLGVLGLTRLLGGGSSAPAPAAAAAASASAAAAVPGTPRRRPLLFLSAAGVISLQPAAATTPRARSGGSASEPIAGIYVSDQARALVQHLAASFDLILIAGWEHDANGARRVAVDGGELAVVTARHGSVDSRIKGVARAARNRPAAWIDEDVDARHKAWASTRPQPTLLVAADDDALREDELVALLDEWADQIALGKRPRQRLVSQP